jgi:hypothetical protein
MKADIEIITCELCGKRVKVVHGVIQAGQMVDEEMFCNVCLKELEDRAKDADDQGDLE